jgi:hypothetical protein
VRQSLALLRGVPLSLELFLGSPAHAVHPARDGVLHYPPNGDYLPGKLGFNLADVNNVDQINNLEAGVKGLVWIGQCSGVDTKFLRTVQPYARSQKLFGFFLMDDPDPRDVLAVAKPLRGTDRGSEPPGSGAAVWH